VQFSDTERKRTARVSMGKMDMWTVLEIIERKNKENKRKK
jgi:hypothetical protein